MPDYITPLEVINLLLCPEWFIQNYNMILGEQSCE